jgi:hypothetical protein
MSYHRYELIPLEEYGDFRHSAAMKQDIAKQPSLLGKTVFFPAQRS